MKIVVIGGTGLIGGKLVSMLAEQGHDAVAASPGTGVNAVTGEGLAEALAGASTVVDVSNAPSYEPQAVMEFFQTATRNLLDAEATAGVHHHVALSVVGTERMPDNGYFAAKVAQERLIEKSPVPYSIVHATQFYEFVRGIADAATVDGEVHIAPVRFQPIAGEEVAQAVGRVALGPPLRGRVEVGGPDQVWMDEFFREALAAWGDPREVVTDRQARYFGSVPGELTLVPGPGAILGKIRYRDWLPHNPAR
ncbi:LysR family transcriptional regulator [Sphaerisporangium rufum]|uniref:LysR family transcriptional regulator n=1 Tax=Sphaerisporangium rufum TaxID=1381558 RepID=A0A919R5I4_9ACTN|nr:SDR family oxidoreductase [Sphaerisporangium rufum]GII80076.1 LysR family transcriptional regulator [Sphaerisporangium rufum]